MESIKSIFSSILSNIQYFFYFWYNSIILQKEFIVQCGKVEVKENDKGFFEIKIPQNTIWTEVYPLPKENDSIFQKREIIKDSQRFLQFCYKTEKQIDYIWCIRFFE